MLNFSNAMVTSTMALHNEHEKLKVSHKQAHDRDALLFYHNLVYRPNSPFFFVGELAHCQIT